MSTKRPRLDDNAAKVRELELELELAKLRSQNEAREEVSSGAGGEAPVEETTTTPASHPGTSSAATSAAAPSATIVPPPPTPATTTGQEPLVRGRGRGGRGARGRSFSLDNRGLQTIFVCEKCDKIYCQTCNHYEQACRYWTRH